MSAQTCSSRDHDPDHSLSEQRFITVGMSRNGRVLIVAHSDRGENIRIISARKTTLASENIMKKRTERRKQTDELRREYDLSKLKGIRGKYATRLSGLNQSRALVTGRG